MEAPAHYTLTIGVILLMVVEILLAEWLYLWLKGKMMQRNYCCMHDGAELEKAKKIEVTYLTCFPKRHTTANRAAR